MIGKISTIVLAAMSRESSYSEREIQARTGTDEREPLTLDQVRDAVKYQRKLGRVEANGWGDAVKVGQGARRPIRWRLRA